MRKASRLAALCMVAFGYFGAAQTAQLASQYQKLARDIFRELVEIKSTESGVGSTPAAEAVARRLIAAGFTPADVQVIGPNERKKNLVARLPGKGAGKPILLLAHLDVVEARREENRRKIDPVLLENSLADVKRQMHNLFELARNATDQETIDNLAVVMGGLEKQKRATQRGLEEFADDEEKRNIIEMEIKRFEQWAQEVRPKLNSAEFQPDYEEVRLAIRCMGLYCVVFPAHGDHPFRHRFFLSPPKIMRHLVENCDAKDWFMVCEAPESAEPSRKMAVPIIKNHLRPN